MLEFPLCFGAESQGREGIPKVIYRSKLANVQEQDYPMLVKDYPMLVTIAQYQLNVIGRRICNF